MRDKEFIERAEAMRERLYRTAYPYLQSQSQAVDAVDEAVFRAYKNRRALREDAYFETWLTRILINVCLTELRRRRVEIVTDELPEQTHEDYDGLPLKEALRRLPEPLRAVITLRYFTGLTLAETAAALEIPQGTVVTRQRRALALLRLELTEEDAL